MGIDRVELIREELKTKKVVYVHHLADKLYVSRSTIRRDLAQLEQEGLVRRFYGGAKLIEHPSNEIPFFMRKERNRAAKEIIAGLATDLVTDNQFVALDTTSTVAYLPRYLKDKENLKILTNNAVSLGLLGSAPFRTDILHGGLDELLFPRLHRRNH